MQLNPTRPFFGLFAMAVFAYMIFILISSDPLTRINRVCAPVIVWPERVVVSGVRIFSPSSVPSFEHAFGTGYSTCRRWTFGVLYRSEYERLRSESETAAANARAREVAAATPTPSSSGVAHSRARRPAPRPATGGEQ